MINHTRANKILLATGSSKADDVIKDQFSKHPIYGNLFMFTDKPGLYREGLIRIIGQENPNILVLRETLQGAEDMMEIIFEIRRSYPLVRIILLTKERPIGDSFLYEMVGVGIYDIINQSTNIDISKILDLAIKPNTFADVYQYRPPIKEVLTNGQKIFDVPNSVIVTKEIIVKEKSPYVAELPIQEEVIDNQEQVHLEKEELNPEDKMPTVIVNMKDIRNSADLNNQPVNVVKSIPIPVPVPIPVPAPPVLTKKEIRITKEKELEEQRKIAIQEKKNKQLEDKVKKEELKKQQIDEQRQTLERQKIEKEKEHQLKKEEPKEKSVPVKVRQTQKPKERKKKKPFFVFGGKSVEDDVQKSNKVISFVGARRGVGTTTLAFNTAVSLANKGKKVVYLDLEQTISSVGYWYKISTNQGIDNLGKFLSNSNYESAINCILSMEEMQISEKSLKLFPKTLDILLYSQDFMLKDNKDGLGEDMIKEIITFLLFQLEYEYIILDCLIDNKQTLNSVLLCSNDVHFIATQDVLDISLISHLLQNTRIPIKKYNFIVNKYVDCNFSNKQIEKWLINEDVSYFKNYRQTLMDCNFNGIPLYLCGTTQQAKDIQDEIDSLI